MGKKKLSIILKTILKALLLKIGLVELWTNENPTSPFAAQYIPIADFDDYIFFIIIAYGSATNYTTGILSAMHGGHLQLQTAIPQSGYAPMVRKRAFYSDRNNKRISVTTGRQQRTNSTTMTETTTDHIPYKIYGIKLGGGVLLSLFTIKNKELGVVICITC